MLEIGWQLNRFPSIRSLNLRRVAGVLEPNPSWLVLFRFKIAGIERVPISFHGCAISSRDELVYQWRWAPGPRRRLWGRAFPLRSHWRKCWRNRPHLRLSCHWASVHRAGFHVPGSKAPSRRCRSERQPVRRAPRYTHAAGKGISGIALLLE